MIIAAILSIAFGSAFYLGNNTNKSIDYAGGSRVLVQVKSDQKIDSQFTKEVNESLLSRLRDGSGLSGIKVTTQADGKLLVSKSGELSPKELNSFVNEIVKKPTLIATTVDLKPLFNLSKFSVSDQIDYSKLKDYQIPFKKNGAEHIERNGYNNIKVSLNGLDGETEYAKATEYLYNQQNNKEILFWLNIDSLYEKAINEYSEDWEASGRNLWNFVHVGNQAYTTGQDGRATENAYKDHQLGIQRDFLIFRRQISYVNDSKDIYIGSEGLTNSQAISLVSKINYALSDYSLELLSTETYSNPNGGSNYAFLYAMIGTVVVFAILSLIQIINYGVIGIATTILMALYIFLTFVIFTSVRGEYSPATISALIIGMLVQFDANVVWFEKFKERMSTGDSINKAFMNTLRYNTRRVFDSNLIMFVSMLILFYLGLNEVKSFASFTVFSIIVVLIVSQVLLRWITISLTKWSLIENKEWFFGLTKVDKKFYNYINANQKDYLKFGKFGWIILLALLLVASIVVATLGAINKSFWSAFNSSRDFVGGYNINIASLNNSEYLFDETKAQNLINFISQKDSNLKELVSSSSIYSINGIDSYKGLSIYVKNYDEATFNKLSEIVKEFNNNLSFNHYELSNSTSVSSLWWTLLGIAISVLVASIYVLFRFGWTFSLSLWVGILVDLAILFISVALTIIYLTSHILIIIAVLFVWSINEKISIFSELRENIQFKFHKVILNKEEIMVVANTSISKKIKRNIIISVGFIFVTIGLILATPTPDKLSSILVFVSLALSTFVTTYLITWLWAKVFAISQRNKQKRIDSGFWNINKVEEQTFNGINDYL
ncbi:protein translocase subunit SecDF [Mycoplasmopsis edwardii]|uniref:Preprotein translocase subunit SecD n=1 Tax=Mycoplasmopsis edwardii TaxID=53558 RepID=A0ACD4PIJ1_9BACT|nr:preprotein translocase subunit SecD [Mycoplasmopsis edwardii]WBP83853.1 preprotein translocase subunit SecD [Mycoplasmopsis edwardii]